MHNGIHGTDEEHEDASKALEHRCNDNREKRVESDRDRFLPLLFAFEIENLTYE